MKKKLLSLFLALTLALSLSVPALAVTAQEAQTLYNAILKDMEAGRFGRNAFRPDRWVQETYSNRLTLYYITWVDENGDPVTDSLELEFSVNSTEVLSALEELGLTEQVPLVTYAQEDQQSGGGTESLG